MGIHWVGIVFGLGAVISMGYWTTDFLVVQRVLSAKDLRVGQDRTDHRRGFQNDGSVHRDPSRLAGAWQSAAAEAVPANRAAVAAGQGHSYDEVLPLMLARYCGPGLLGLGITALIAGFMSGMAGQRQRLRHGLDVRHLSAR